MITKLNLKKKYNIGDEVSPKLKPEEVLIVKRHVDGLYFCSIKGMSEKNEKAYFEIELVKSQNLVSEDLRFHYLPY